MDILHGQFVHRCGFVAQRVFGIIGGQINDDFISGSFDTAELLFCGLAGGGQMAVNGQVVKDTVQRFADKAARAIFVRQGKQVPQRGLYCFGFGAQRAPAVFSALT